jgi:hypothetical protein
VSLFADVRAAAARVADRARFVHIEPRPLERLAEDLRSELEQDLGSELEQDPASEREGSASAAQPDPAHQRLGSEAETLAYIVTLDAINFGSGWFPVLRKRPGCSGYFTVATALEERFAREGAFTASELQALEAARVARLLGQHPTDPEVGELMEHFARALRDLGDLLVERHAGRFDALVASAGGRAEALVRELARMPLYRDVSRYEDFDVPLYKRAQLTAADLATAFEGKGPGRFDDLAELTMFADNLVPHVLRCAGVLVYDSGLAARIDGGQRLAAGSPEEIEIRAVALHAVEGMVRMLRARGTTGATAHRLDSLLWHRGQAPALKARPRHRARSVFY